MFSTDVAVNASAKLTFLQIENVCKTPHSRLIKDIFQTCFVDCFTFIDPKAGQN